MVFYSSHSLAMTISEKPTEDDLLSEYSTTTTPYVFSELPEYACSYCGIHNPKSVTRCRDCGKWFCNGKGGGIASHSIQHMVKSRHK